MRASGALAGLLLPWAGGALAHEAGEAAGPTLEAVRVEEEIRLDGRLDEEVWKRAPAARGFTQREPRPGEPAGEETEIRIVYTRRTLYVGIHAFAADPAKIVAGEMGLDADLFRDDSVIVLLDTFDDHRNAYFFETNANGARTDALITDEGQDQNFDWDGVWEVRTQRLSDGWSAEMAIPFSTLRFERALERWGLNFRRLIRHRNEEVFWAPVPLEADLYRLSRAGHLTGIRDVEMGHNVQVKPFGVASQSTSYAGGGRDERRESDGGLDLKWGLGRNLSLDLTYRTDFAETEVDDQRVNLTRFSLFFPEKRDFFLENAGIFEFGFSGDWQWAGGPFIKPFFSRRIGLGPDGEQVPIDGGFRLTGRTGPWSLGVLGIGTDSADAAGGGDISDSNWGAARLKRNFGGRSSAGMLFTHRDAGRDDFNRMFGLDTTLVPADKVKIELFGLVSETPSLGDDDWAGGAGLAWAGEIWAWRLDAIEARRDFNPELGFLLRGGAERDPLTGAAVTGEGVRRHFGQLSYRPRPADSPVRNWIYRGTAIVFTRDDGEIETIETSFDYFGFRLQNELEVIWWADVFQERLTEPFEIHPGVVIPPGRYDYHDFGIFVETNEGARVALNAWAMAGEFFDGRTRASEATVTFRPSRFLRSETAWKRDDVELPAGDFTAAVLRQRLTWSFTPESSVSLLAQYNNTADLMSLNARFTLRYRPGSELFVVYNHNWDALHFEPGDLETRDRRLTIKVAHMFRP